eukprot:COSAG02_NODE_12205_length_1580_cov_4.072248_2_plen_76_part_00
MYTLILYAVRPLEQDYVIDKLTEKSAVDAVDHLHSLRSVPIITEIMGVLTRPPEERFRLRRQCRFPLIIRGFTPV